MKKLQGLLSAIAFVLLLSGCSNTKEVAYFQDVNNGSTLDLIKSSEIKFRPNDKMTIVVNCRDPKLAALYNLPVISQRLGEEKAYSNTSYQMSMYSVDANGDINFPIIGKIHVEGMNRQEVAEAVKSKLSSEIKDVSVTVEFANMFVSCSAKSTREVSSTSSRTEQPSWKFSARQATSPSRVCVPMSR